MQQTETYQLNLIEATDTFSPNPLNENTEKVEAALSAIRSEAAAGDAAEAQTRAQGDAALAQRVTTLEGLKVYVGYYTGNGTTSQFVPLGFTPSAVLIKDSDGTYSLRLVTEDAPLRSTWGTYFQIQEGGFLAGAASNASMTTKNAKYYFVAFP